ncbi:hypothetical protein [Streptomyces hokutonensis]|uniref:hypothetical protein n=1 Tax=Streptomyces hokutonensis TaxID=1306990 RepID=UPI000376D832|nr:hypothetical protein [Streptomyces hokutonensis]
MLRDADFIGRLPGEAVEYRGEWDFPLNRLLHKALDLCTARRRGAFLRAEAQVR